MTKNELTTFCLYTFRYALDRETGISREISNLILKYAEGLDEWVKTQIKRDIKRKIDSNGFKHVHDLENWKNLMDKL